MGFFGEFNYKVDDKGRVPLPPRFREELNKGMYLTRGVDGCIVIYPLPEWEKESARVSAMPDNDAGRAHKRLFFSGANELKMDRLGRIALPPSLRKDAEIGDTVVVIGANLTANLWSPEKWEAEKARALAQAWNTAEKMSGADRP
ncbi:MAG: division/cell wall cluster transcriptional repressor MraZ [Chloroflexi bacterium]|nr:division/cell wall cluster transcriptional repressor MraZ [Chloroflexota bacterium]